jgi:hypothetical protein
VRKKWVSTGHLQKEDMEKEFKFAGVVVVGTLLFKNMEFIYVGNALEKLHMN